MPWIAAPLVTWGGGAIELNGAKWHKKEFFLVERAEFG
jgi:hypothetical protein